MSSFVYWLVKWDPRVKNKFWQKKRPKSIKKKTGFFAMKKMCFHTYRVANAGTLEYAVTVDLCGKLVFGQLSSINMINAMIIRQLKLCAKFDLKYQRVFTTNNTYFRMLRFTKHTIKLISKCLLVSYSL